MPKARVIGATCLLLLAAALVFPPAARADSQVRIVRLSLVSGPVQIDRATGQGFEKAILNMPITQGTKLWAGDQSRAEVEFEDGTSMRLTPGAKVDFEQLTLLSSGGRATTVHVDEGTVYFNVRHKGDDSFRVAFANQELNLTRSVHFRLELARDQAAVAVFQGDLALDTSRKLKKNETATLDFSDQGRYQVAKGISTNTYDEWDSYRLEYANTYASAGSRNVPYYYGRSDLNYYGSWGYINGYGNLWRPFGVGYGWDPYSSGHLVWYPGWGYTWVSDYPWGWTPFRYGSWLWVNNYGWCWQPGLYNTWNALPRIQNPPPSYTPPQVPVGGPGVGTGAPHPTVIVNRGPGFIQNRGGRLFSDDTPVPVAGESLGAGAATGGSAATGAASAKTTNVKPAPGTTVAPAAAQPQRPIRTAVPRSGPGLGRRPVPMDDTGVQMTRGSRGRMDGERPIFVPPAHGPAASPSSRTSGSQPSAPHSAPSHTSAPPAPRSAPSAPHATPPPSAPRSAPSGSASRVRN